MQNMKQIKYTIVSLILLFVALPLSAQTLEEAKKMYKQGEYAQPKEVFRKQLKSRPNDAQLNQWYGVCLYETGEAEKAEPYLQKAAKKKIQDSYLYLGKIAFDNYNFTQAKEYFEQYIEALEKNKGDVEKGENLYKRASRCESMLRRTEKVQIIDSIIVARERFLDSYKLSHECGSLSYFSDIFKGDEEGTLYKNQRNDKVLYATPTDSIYSIKMRNRMNDGNWSEEIPVEVIPDVEGNKAYPYLLSDGLTLYFATDNDSLSIGGYDIFVTRKNLNSDEYLSPSNLGMPFNSTANDYMMVIDEYHNVGWFATERNQPSDSVAIYIYIPNEIKEIYSDLSLDSIKPYAQITSISQTWLEGEEQNYKQLLKQVYTEIKPIQSKDEADFEFIIIPGVTYTKYTQFKNPKALELYKLAEGVEREIANQQATLKELRTKYAKATPSQKEKLAELILKAEDNLKTLYPQPEQYRNAARREEVK